MTEEKRAPPLPAHRAKLPSVSGGAPQAPTPLRVPNAVSPRPPSVVSGAEGHEPSPEPPHATEVAKGMSHIAIEATLADLTAWRRGADRRIARLEAELAQLGAPPGAASPPTASALAAAPPVDAGRPPFDTVALPPEPSPAAPVVAAVPVAEAASPGPLRVPAVGQPAPRPQYDLELRPGETIDIPTALDGGRRKKLLVWLALLFLVGGMGALVVSTLASQR